MTTPVWQAVWDDLVEALALITTGGGYHYTLSAANISTDMINLIGWPTAPVVMIGPSEGSSRVFLASLRARDRIVFGLEARVDAPGTDPARKGEAFTDFVADIERALMVDMTRGGFAARTLIRPPVGPFMGFGAQQQVLFSQEIEIDLIRAYGAS